MLPSDNIPMNSQYYLMKLSYCEKHHRISVENISPCDYKINNWQDPNPKFIQQYFDGVIILNDDTKPKKSKKKKLHLNLRFILLLMYLTSILAGVSFAVETPKNTLSQDLNSTNDLNPDLIEGNDNTTKNKIGLVSFNEAFDDGLTWNTGGNTSWIGYDNGTADYAKSTSIDDKEQTWIETTLNGPGTLKYWWKVSSENNYDYLYLFLDGAIVYGITGEVNWEQRILYLNQGLHTLRWVYQKDEMSSNGTDEGLVDGVEWIPGINPDLNSGSYAILAGVNKYPFINKLYCCDDDVYDMYRVCSEIWKMPTSNIFSLVDSLASKSNIHNMINTLAALMTAQNTFIFYFSGHGSYAPDEEPFDETDGKDEYICPYDTTKKDSTMISDDELFSWFGVLPTFKVLSIFDSCFSGGMIPNKGAINDTSLLRYMYLAACNENETCSEDSSLPNGFFTYYLTEAFKGVTDPLIDLDGDQTISVEEAFKYALNNVTLTQPYTPQIYDPDETVEFEIPEKVIAINSSIPVNDIIVNSNPFATIFELDNNINPASQVNISNQVDENNNTNSSPVQQDIIEFLTFMLVVFSGIVVFKLK